MARLSGRVISLTRAMATSSTRWIMMRFSARAEAMASGSALITMSQRSARSNSSCRWVSFVSSFLK